MEARMAASINDRATVRMGLLLRSSKLANTRTKIRKLDVYWLVIDGLAIPGEHPLRRRGPRKQGLTGRIPTDAEQTLRKPDQLG
jgi:hypothetical protein